jgi:type VII secretion integral membrane protein EccD
MRWGGAIVAGANDGGLSRVTVIAPNRRMDLTIPADVPLADMLPTLLRYGGDHLANEGAAKGGWRLTRLGGVSLDGSRTAGEQGILDGEQLFLEPFQNHAPPPVFDDLVDAVATATQDAAGRWGLSTTRRFSVAFTAAALVGGAVAVLFAGPPRSTAAIVGLLAGAILLIAATLVSRAGGDGRAGALLGLVSLGYAGVGGLLLGGDVPLTQLASPHALLAATAVIVYASVATIAVGSAKPLFLGASLAGGALAIGAFISMSFGVGPQAAAAVIGTVAFAVVPTIPRLAYRSAGLKVPSIPTGPDDVKNDTETVDGVDVLRRSARAQEFMTSMLGTVGVIVGGSAVVVGTHGGLPGVLLCAVLSVCLMLRARPLSGRAQRLALLIPGSIGVALAVLTAALIVTGLLRLTAVLGGLVVLAVASMVYGFAIAGKKISPVWGRMLDILEIILIVAIVPLALWVCGMYGWITTIGQ